MMIADVTATGDDNVLSAQANDVSYRKEQLRRLQEERNAGRLAQELNRITPGLSGTVQSTARKLRTVAPEMLAADAPATLGGIDPAWSQRPVWATLKEATRVYTDRHFLTALDLERAEDGSISGRTSARIYLKLYAKTMKIGFFITLLTLAYFLAHQPRQRANMLMIFVLLPFWTSLLVRTTAWIALLQTNGVINSLLMGLGLTSSPIEVLYTETATIIAMTHILLPFMVLPLYSVMISLDGSYVRAAMSMGATPFRAFLTVYLPNTVTGISAGAMLVFIISVGYYITPALVGGTDGQMISNLIAFHMQQSNNWGLAAALGSLLLALILVLYWIFDRLFGMDNIKLG
jgi:putative spermidine/putrescine transport system permease protein